jgi:ABC-2 type transport system permease protein
MVIWDRQFGFLKEIMVTPNSRLSVALGRIAGGATTAVIPSLLVLLLSLFVGFHPYVSMAMLWILVLVVLIGIIFISVGLTLASFVDDPQAYGVIVNFFTFPLFFLSGSLFPLTTLPQAVQYVSYANPLTYGVDGIRYALTGASAFPLAIDLLALFAAAVIMVLLSTWAFKKSEVD